MGRHVNTEFDTGVGLMFSCPHYPRSGRFSSLDDPYPFRKTMNLLKTFFILIFAIGPACTRAQQFDLAGGYNYQISDQGDGLRTNLNGWFASGQFDLNDHFALTLEADSY